MGVGVKGEGVFIVGWYDVVEVDLPRGVWMRLR